jgi:hypothetical protein
MKLKIAGLVAIAALLAGPASAQQSQMPGYHTPGPGELDKPKSRGEIAAEKEAEQAYKRSLGNIQEQKAADPWGMARGDNAAPKAAAKAAPAKPKPPKTAAKPETSAKQ